MNRKILLLLSIVIATGLSLGYGFSRYLSYTQSTVDMVSATDYARLLIDQEEYIQQIYKNSPSGNYLAGYIARREKDWLNAYDYMEAVLEEEGEDYKPDLKKYMMVLTMEAGYNNKAFLYAKEVLQSDPNNPLALLFHVVHDIKNEEYVVASNNIQKIKKTDPLYFIVPILNLWINSAQGSLTIDQPIDNSFYLYNALLAAKSINKVDVVIPIIEKSFGTAKFDIRDTQKIADMLLYLDQKELALQFYNILLTNPYLAPSVKKHIDKISDNSFNKDDLEIADVQNSKEGIAHVFLDMAYIFIREKSHDSAAIFAQIALYLSPELTQARLLISDILVQSNQFELARDYLLAIKETDENYVRAQTELATIYAEEDKHDQAIETLQILYTKNQDIEALIEVGNLFRDKEDYIQAIKTYSDVIQKIEQDDTLSEEEYWYLFYVRGMAYERAKKFDLSEKDLLKALEYQPDHPHLLNYLAYSWVDQNKKIDQALEMLLKAHKLLPNDGYIADSVGWAYFKKGDLVKAIQYLEHAVEILPYDATINDHLGDVYWLSGRKTEARFQWQRAYNYSEDNDAALKETIQKKLNDPQAIIKNLYPDIDHI